MIVQFIAPDFLFAKSKHFVSFSYTNEPRLVPMARK
jgi:hypothetical protein